MLAFPSFPCRPMAAATLALLALCGCDTEPSPPASPTPAPVVAPPPPQLSTPELEAAVPDAQLVPSPAETVKALENAGIANAIAIPTRAMDMKAANKDVVAVRTGVALADCLLTVKDAPKDKLVERLTLVQSGMSALDAGPNVDSLLVDLIARVKNDSSTREDLLKDLDEMHGNILPEIKFQTGGERFIPLIQAGSWLEGSNVLSQAILAANKPDVGTQLLRQPAVVYYFLGYLQSEGADKAPGNVLGALKESLTRLQAIASKPALTAADVSDVQAETNAVLTLL